MKSSEPGLPLARRALLGLMAGALLLPLLPGIAFAQSLDEARAQGIVGERPDGLVAAVGPSTPLWATSLIADINSKRMQKYAELAAANGTTVEAVQVVAGEKIIASLPTGAWYMDAMGSWVQK